MFNDEWVGYQSPDDLRAKSATSRALIDEMKDAGIFVYAEGGIDSSTALFSVETKDGKPVFSDGPYVETKEHIGGFTVIDVPDDDTAREWAGRMALTLDWPQEVHRFGANVEETIERLHSGGA
nr:YciI family protein [Flexivirga oryzae]